MLPRLLTPLCLGLYLGHAHGDELTASGGQWSRYKSDSQPGSNLGNLVSRGDEIQVNGIYQLKVNHETGAADQAARPSFNPNTDLIVADGDSPVFWTRSWAEPSGAISVRDWTTGAVIGTAAVPQEMTHARFHIDQHGVVMIGNGKVGVCGHNGENAQVAAAPISMSGFQTRIDASSQAFAVSFETASTFNRRIEVYDRSTLAFQGGWGNTGYPVGLEGNLLACQTGNAVTVRELPSLSVRASIPLQPNGGLLDLQMVDGGLWLLQRAGNPFEKEFRYYDLSNPSAPAAANRLTPPAWSSYLGGLHVPLLASDDFIAFIADDKSVWVWSQGEEGPVASIVPSGAGREGQAAGFKVKLSHASATAAQVQVSAQSASAMEGQDFQAFSMTVTIPAGALESSEQQINILEDTVLEPNESLILASGTTSGCVVEETKVPLKIKANGFNATVHRKFLNNGSVRVSDVWGVEGGNLVATVYGFPQMGTDYGRTVTIDAASGAITSEMAGSTDYLSNDTREVVDGMLFRNSTHTVSAWQVPGFQSIASNVSSGGKALAPINSQHLLASASEPQRILVTKISDGSAVASKTLEASGGDAVVAQTMAGVNGRAVVLAYIGTHPEGGNALFFQILHPSTLEVIRTFTWPYYHPKLGTSPKLVSAGGRHAIFASNHAISAMDTMTGEWLWSTSTRHQSSLGVDYCISGDVLAVRGISLNDASDEFSRFRFYDLKSGALLEDLRFEEVSGKPLFAVSRTEIQATPTGFLLMNGGQAVSLTTTPTRPNVEVLAEAFEDNRSGEVRIVPKENFSGSHTLVIDEYAETLEDLSTSGRLIGTLPRQIELTAAGASMPLDCRRPANASELARLRAMSPGSMGAAAGFGTATVTTHVEPMVEQLFFTGAPARQTHSTPLATGAQVLAVGYPTEPDQAGRPTGLVDLYDTSTGAYLRTINAPANAVAMSFGASLAITGNRIVIGAPGNNTGYPSMPGKVFVFDLTSGAMLKELKLGKTMAFGASIAANESWIAVGAPGTYRVLPPTGQSGRKLVPGTVAVFDATTYKMRYKSTTKGEMLGWSVALKGDTLFAGAPMASLALPSFTAFAGIVRPYALPKGKTKGKALPILGALRPMERGRYGERISASSTLLAVYASPGADGHAGLQLHAQENLLQVAVLGVPGDDLEEECGLHVTDSLVFNGSPGEPLRIFDLDDARPELSYSLPFVRDIKTDATHFYWADKLPHRAPLPAAAASGASMAKSTIANHGDQNLDGRVDEIDLLIQTRSTKGLPVSIESSTAVAGMEGVRSFRFALDADIPEGSEVEFEYTTNLSDWSPLLSWDSASSRWLDAKGAAIGAVGGENWFYEWQASAGKVFFRTRVNDGE
ncbi:hypothetical protein OJ996_05950 [Luteolibacter sp. GHJ8]|uniref:Outer membrane protein assembly factor BamB n=1 Tax=Luteolibacter rhizosphaerae TaxID=2989719 RepID=A0ABT3G0I4_9BACT|nr:hypothetical protein [Luteolibacter rhizosphaerae]MCW1913104.1 hypothetical protein [Luteolibacter rhizosphaerae]